MPSKLWPGTWSGRTWALSGLGCLFVLSVVVAIVQVSVAGAAGVAAILVPAITAITSYIAVVIPPSKTQAARMDTTHLIYSYTLLQDASDHQRNVAITEMRGLAPDAKYSAQAIQQYLTDAVNEARHYAGLASIQWQWPIDTATAREIGFERPLEHIKTLDAAQLHDTSYFPQLLDLLCKRVGRQYESYHAMIAMWGLEPHLSSCQRRQLYQSILDGCDCPLPYTNEHWDSFKWYLTRQRALSGSADRA